MTPILLNQLRSSITSPLISIFCKKFEENETLLRKSIDTSICTVLIGLDNVIKTNSLFLKIIDSISNSEFYNSIEYENGKLSSINYSFEHEGNIPLNLIFSIKKGRISEMISNEIGIKSETAISILNFAVMLILCHFKNEKQKEKNIQFSLHAEKTSIISTLPEGIRIMLGYSNFKCEEEILNTTNPLLQSKYKNKFLSKIFNL
ncbi:MULTISPECIES: hypothetical protein [Flavobacterium]|uniref:hypothetical protein n=1 Tax=Flavobacterium TaxID=237 RepID=UPI002481EF37|nr:MULTISPECIES: hypothetical protein [Flavobacterium]